MKTLNKQSTQTMNKMVSMMEEGYIKIDNTGGSFMPVSVEQIFENDNYRIFSVAHYYEQNGDLMADPEMCFLMDIKSSKYLPSYFKQDNIGVEQESIIMERGEIIEYKAKLQAEHAEFANMWLSNIKNQQNI